ncbi:MAG: 30S ribosomal protein S3 [Gammaproteobacteria bacterium]|nr:30S ribosomal protein S3 [Gammaproteobacteria bacterium]
MGQKVHPVGFRLGKIYKHQSCWYKKSKDYPDFVFSDMMVRQFIMKRYPGAMISKIHIHRPANNALIRICTARPGIVIGKKGEDIERLKADVSKLMGVPVHINIEEIKKPELDAKLVAESVAEQIQNRVMYRRAMRRAVSNTMKLGAEGIKICVSGRLGGAEIARADWYREGRVPLHTLRADIDYHIAEAKTTYGIIGVKVWIYKGEVLDKESVSI